jgi:hypothetical protein
MWVDARVRGACDARAAHEIKNKMRQSHDQPSTTTDRWTPPPPSNPTHTRPPAPHTDTEIDWSTYMDQLAVIDKVGFEGVCV